MLENEVGCVIRVGVPAMPHRFVAISVVTAVKVAWVATILISFILVRSSCPLDEVFQFLGGVVDDVRARTVHFVLLLSVAILHN